MKISWTLTARESYFRILDYLSENWSKKEIEAFITEVENLLSQISQNPQMFPASQKRKYIRKGLISKHNTLFYRIKPRKREIELLTFWDNRQNPQKLKY